MSETGLKLALLIGILTIGSGVFDSFAFTFASRMWEDGRLIMGPAIKAAASFAVGITLYFLAIRYFGEAGIVLPENQIKVSELESRNADEKEQIDVLQQCLQLQRKRQGITDPTDG